MCRASSLCSQFRQETTEIKGDEDSWWCLADNDLKLSTEGLIICHTGPGPWHNQI